MTETPSGEYDEVTSDRETIRQWIEDHGGEPAVTTDGSGTETPGVRLGGDHGDREPVPWDVFFDRLDSAGLALAYRTDEVGGTGPPAFEFVPRGDGPAADDADVDREREGHEGVTNADARTADRRSEVREREAEKQENPDNHRDREPFQG